MTGRFVRWTWLALGAVATAVLLVAGTFHIVNALARQTVVEEQTFPAGDIAVLDVRSPNGTIEVLGGDVERITVTAEVTRGLRRTSHRAVVTGDTLELRSSCPPLGGWCEVDYRVEVPSGLTVRGSSDNGRVIVRDITGPVTADAENGSVELARLSGPVDVRTQNGSVAGTGLRTDVATARTENGRVTLEFTVPPGRVEARSSNGRVDIIVPDTQDPYLVRLDTHKGSTDIGVRTDPTSRRSIVARTRNGDVTARYATG